ncbi:hypothetical protein CPU12_06395 [Malaciobacter molluscorum LMG 25693]|uniref:histidine kinase n=1 Tax=Malaciobacter molluscorum LMG 25693 TaxID=870501 RepID=A0A2G1DIN2_9BACT|nr:histidine kinase dimerization/phosphoacceptor domain -containing protein [Malaciobacter molluscorum]AXX91943.1 two-component system sensor histidine kinase [Malaciobacter molluscorum LMG 25693]PHO18347.1 hypothetical protein CPU12_06395 [Malaciobacter molluscorum LMG 25693]
MNQIKRKLPLSLKIVLSFFILGVILLTILFILVIPNIKKKDYESAIFQTEKIVLLTRQEIKLVVEYFRRYGKSETNIHKMDITNKIEKIQLEEKYNKKYNNFYNDLKDISNNYTCNIKLNNDLIFKNLNIHKNYSEDIFENNKWIIKSAVTYKTICPHEKYYLYKTKIAQNNLYLTCDSNFKQNSFNVEANVKKTVQKGFELTQNIHNGKIYLIWVNNNIKNMNISFENLKNENNKNFCVSNISSLKIPKTGNLKVQDIFNVDDIKTFEHKLEKKSALTWVSKIYEDEDEKFFLILTSFKKDFENSLNNSLLNILPISIIALIVSICLGFLLFRRWIISVEKLSFTARNICNGNLSLRSNIKGDDDIGVLGVAFDSMLNTLEDNIKQLDLKVENRTKELTQSLNEKEILLKEIHHRVKNNLAMTINFIRFQKYKVDDSSTKEMLSQIENRIYTMELLHRKLYESKNLNLIDIKKYISELVNDISKSFDDGNVNIILDIDIFLMSIDYAMPCGLIINEALTNSYKYAFNNKIDKQIKISFKVYNSKNCVLKIKDNGIGLPKGFDFDKAKSLGLRLIYSISKNQLLGEINYKYNKGTEFIIEFILLDN